MGFVRFIIAILLLPVAFGVTHVFFCYLKDGLSSCLLFVLGIASYTFIYPVFKKPLKSYVIGHELTHVLGVWLFRGRIHGFKISKNGGAVKANKTNMWIKLSPYFFPIYTIFVLCIYLLLAIVIDMSKYLNIIAYLLGVTWAFHLWMTLYILSKNQPDVNDQGIVFSTVVIYIINIAVLSSLFAFVSPELSIYEYFVSCWEKINNNYSWAANVVSVVTKNIIKI